MRPSLPGRGVRASVATLVLLGAAVAAPGGPLSAQSTVATMAEECHGGVPALQAPCEDAALVLQATQWATGLLTTAGGALPASPSTSGMRIAGSPRVILDGGLALANVRFPSRGGTWRGSGTSERP
jgi:hypothetical protein